MPKAILPFSAILLGEEEIEEVVDTLRSGWLTTGPKVAEFEHAFAEYVGAPAAVALSSGTAALHVALAVIGVGPGDAVITSPMTFCSTVHVIEQSGAHPVLIDVQPDTLNIDPEHVARAVETTRREGRNVRVIMPVHYAGHPCDMDLVFEIASEFNLAVVEDAAHAFPARHSALGDIGAIQDHAPGHAVGFSFYATKNITTGEGGMLTGSPSFVDRARLLSLHGMSRDAWKRYGSGGSWFYEVQAPGFKYNMMDIQAALGLHQLNRVEQFELRRREIALKYSEAFSEIRGLQPPTEKGSVTHSWHLYVLRIVANELTIDRDGFIRCLTDRKIGTSLHFIPIHMHAYYRDRYGYSPDDFPVTLDSFLRMLSLPLYPKMTDSEVDAVISAVTEVALSHQA